LASANRTWQAAEAIAEAGELSMNLKRFLALALSVGVMATVLAVTLNGGNGQSRATVSVVAASVQSSDTSTTAGDPWD
jgi:hypothetical protein